jgi:hypothetical protein
VVGGDVGVGRQSLQEEPTLAATHKIPVSTKKKKKNKRHRAVLNPKL